MFIMLCGYPPFQGDSDIEILENVQLGVYEFASPDWDQVSAEAKALISRMLTIKPEHRISAGEAVEHAWIDTYAPQYNTITESHLHTLTNIKTLKSEHKLQAAVLAYIVAQLLSKEEVD
jgi:calcium-dependent protein kinase